MWHKLIPILFLFLLACQPTNLPTQITEPIEVQPLPENFMRGVSYAHTHRGNGGYGSLTSQTTLDHLKTIGVTHTSITPFGYQQHVEDSEVRMSNDRSLRDQNLISEINNQHNKGLAVMLKPHVWSSEFWNNEKWRGDINPKDQQRWFDSYQKFILHYAHIAQTTNTEILVIAHEFAQLSSNDNEWRKIIKEIRKVYSGKLVYSADQNEYQYITFWDDLDYIGINAYFPLTQKSDATPEEIAQGWQPTIKTLKAKSQEYNKPIIFTEVGYKSSQGTTNRPWEWNSNAQSDQQEQADAYHALYYILSQNDFIVGAYPWKYFTTPRSQPDDKDFTIRGKLAEQTISNWYQQTPSDSKQN